MNPSLRHVGIVVDDMENCVNFWRDIMKFKVLKELDEKGKNLDKMIGLLNIDIHTTKLIDKNNNIIELIKFNSHNSVAQAWHGNQFSLGLTHIAVTVENINYFFENIKSVYGDFGTTICKSDDGNVKMAYVKGPEGLLIELVEELK